NFFHSDAFPDIGKHEGANAPHLSRVPIYDFQTCAHHRLQIDLVDDQKVGSGYSGASLAEDFVSGGDIDDIDGEVGEFRTESRGQIVSAGFHQNKIEIWKPPA